ncbi:hypothetical protein [Burkholderia glumae]|uniref:hypothetical protein n=1 Tax=Burkholderia glumae TaxID=337 RepID=UPI0021514E33|nr:hypothetical protein [Burkholderia glumae]
MNDQELLGLAARAVNGGSWHPLTHSKPWSFIVTSLLAFLAAIGIAMIPDSSAAVRGVWGA